MSQVRLPGKQSKAISVQTELSIDICEREGNCLGYDIVTTKVFAAPQGVLELK